MDSMAADSRKDRHLMRQRGAGFGTRELKFADFGFKIRRNENSLQKSPAILANATSEPVPLVDPANAVLQLAVGPMTNMKGKAPEKWAAADELTDVPRERRGRPPAKLGVVDPEMQGQQDASKRTRVTPGDEAVMSPQKRRVRQPKCVIEASGQRQGIKPSLSQREEVRDNETKVHCEIALHEHETVPKKRRGRPKKSEMPSNLDPEEQDALSYQDVKLEDTVSVHSKISSGKTKKTARMTRETETASVEAAESEAGEAVVEEQTMAQSKEPHRVRASETEELKSEPQGIAMETNPKRPGREKRQTTISRGLAKPVMFSEEERRGYVLTNINAVPEQVSLAGTPGVVTKRKQDRPTVDENSQVKVLKLATSRRTDNVEAETHQEARVLMQGGDPASGIALANLVKRVEQTKGTSDETANSGISLSASSAIGLLQTATGTVRRASKGPKSGTASKSHLLANLEPLARPPLTERASNALEQSRLSKHRHKASRSEDWVAPDWFKASVPPALVRSNDPRLQFRF